MRNKEITTLCKIMTKMVSRYKCYVSKQTEPAAHLFLNQFPIWKCQQFQKYIRQDRMGLEIFALMLASSQLAMYGLVIGKSLMDNTNTKQKVSRRPTGKTTTLKKLLKHCFGTIQCWRIYFRNKRKHHPNTHILPVSILEAFRAFRKYSYI